MSDEEFIASLTQGAVDRYERFPHHLRLQNEVGDRINRILDEDGEKMKVRDGADHRLSMFVSTGLGKAMKTFQAIVRVCLFGFGEDAAILLRSNVNLLINLRYIVGDQEPNERAADFAADSWREYAKAMKMGHNVELPPEDVPFPPDELNFRADRWRKTTIADRAKRLPKHHYDVGYRFYSSIEHSDALALMGYLGDWNEQGPFIAAGPSDSHVDAVLMHSADVMVAVLDVVCTYFGIKRPDIFAELGALFSKFANDGKAAQ